LLTQWIVKYGYVPVVLIGMAGLAYDVGTRESNSAVTIVAKTPVVTETPVVAETPVVTETPVVAEDAAGSTRPECSIAG